MEAVSTAGLAFFRSADFGAWLMLVLFLGQVAGIFALYEWSKYIGILYGMSRGPLLYVVFDNCRKYPTQKVQFHHWIRATLTVLLYIDVIQFIVQEYNNIKYERYPQFDDIPSAK